MDAGGQAESVESDAIWRARMSSSLDDLRSAGAEAFAPLQIKVCVWYLNTKRGQRPASASPAAVFLTFQCHDSDIAWGVLAFRILGGTLAPRQG